MKKTNLKLGIIGISNGNGHPYSWSAIFNGYDTTANNNSFDNVTNSSTAIDSDGIPFDFVSISTDDIHSTSTNVNDRGFRLKGNITMNSIKRKDC